MVFEIALNNYKSSFQLNEKYDYHIFAIVKLDL